MKYNVLASTFEGTDEPAYYNSRVGGKFFRPVESYEDPEVRRNMSKAQKKRYEDPEERRKTSKAQKKRYEDPEERRKISEGMKGNTNAKKKKKNARR